jgi:outer membrane protein OmpA-like peptidoglycan-associated protein
MKIYHWLGKENNAFKFIGMCWLGFFFVITGLVLFAFFAIDGRSSEYIIDDDFVVLSRDWDVVRESEYVNELLLRGIDVLFLENDTTLSFDGQRKLDQFGHLLTYRHNLTIVGHTNNRGSAAFNGELSFRRTIVVAGYLEKYRAYGSQINVVNFGENQPIASNITAEGRAANDRVEVLINVGPQSLNPLVLLSNLPTWASNLASVYALLGALASCIAFFARRAGNRKKVERNVSGPA